MWLGEVVRALGMLGLLLGMFYAGLSMVNAVGLYNDPVFTSAVTWVRVFDLLPVVAFVALLNGRRTLAKIVAGGLPEEKIRSLIKVAQSSPSSSPRSTSRSPAAASPGCGVAPIW